MQCFYFDFNAARISKAISLPSAFSTEACSLLFNASATRCSLAIPRTVNKKGSLPLCEGTGYTKTHGYHFWGFWIGFFAAQVDGKSWNLNIMLSLVALKPNRCLFSFCGPSKTKVLDHSQSSQTKMLHQIKPAVFSSFAAPMLVISRSCRIFTQPNQLFAWQSASCWHEMNPCVWDIRY